MMPRSFTLTLLVATLLSASGYEIARAGETPEADFQMGFVPFDIWKVGMRKE